MAELTDRKKAARLRQQSCLCVCVRANAPQSSPSRNSENTCWLLGSTHTLLLSSGSPAAACTILRCGICVRTVMLHYWQLKHVSNDCICSCACFTTCSQHDSGAIAVCFCSPVFQSPSSLSPPAPARTSQPLCPPRSHLAPQELVSSCHSCSPSLFPLACSNLILLIFLINTLKPARSGLNST